MRLAKFINKKSYERIEHVLHRHPITFLPTVFLFLILSSLPFVLYFVFENFFRVFFNQGSPLAIIVILLTSFYYIVLLCFFFIEFVLYYLDIWVVTNDRIIDVDQINIFSRTVSELDLASVQDATTEIKGFFPTMFDYGKLIIKTASDNAHIVFHDIAHPNKIRTKIIDLSDEDKERHVLLRDNVTKIK